MIADALLLSILIGLIRRGRIRGLASIPLRCVILFILPFLILAAVYAARSFGGESLSPYMRAANVVEYVVLLAAIALNLHIREMWIAGAGAFMNFLVVAANGGMMPISEKAIQMAGMTQMIEDCRAGSFVRHVIMSPETRLKPLADIIPKPGFAFVMPEVASIGDVLLAIGIFVLVQRYMMRPAGE